MHIGEVCAIQCAQVLHRCFNHVDVSVSNEAKAFGPIDDMLNF